MSLGDERKHLGLARGEARAIRLRGRPRSARNPTDAALSKPPSHHGGRWGGPEVRQIGKSPALGVGVAVCERKRGLYGWPSSAQVDAASRQ